MITNLDDIKAAIFEVGLLFNQQPDDAKINAYAKALQNYSPKQITFAFNQVILSGSAFFPSLAEILKHLRPSVESNQDRAPIIANEILSLLRQFGSYSEKEMIEAASPEARLTFLALGHTADIRNSENIDTVRAQLERLARGVMQSRDASEKNNKLEKLGIKMADVLEMKKPELKKVDFSNFSQGDPA